MKKIVGLFIALMLFSMASSPAPAGPAPVVATVAGTSTGFGAWLAGGIIGLAAFLDAYDLIRRTTCSGDPLGLGGPGFSEPMPKTGNILKPPCPPKKKG